MTDELGFARPVTEGERVILRTGATATLRRSYPAGYCGEVEILLDGQEERERAGALTLQSNEP